MSKIYIHDTQETKRRDLVEADFSFSFALVVSIMMLDLRWLRVSFNGAVFFLDKSAPLCRAEEYSFLGPFIANEVSMTTVTESLGLLL